MVKLSGILLASSLLFTSSLSAALIDDKVIEFEKQRFSQNKRIKLTKVNINLKKELPKKGWYGYIVEIDALFGDKSVQAKDIVFTDGKVIAPEVFDIATGQDLKELLTPNLTDSYYDEKRLIAGTHNAKDKIVVFSDPLCPYCASLIPDIIEHVKKNEKDIALYYYHFPLLKIHPAADALVKAMAVAKQKGVKDVELKVYRTNWNQYFGAESKNTKRILETFNKELQTNISLEDIKNEEIKEKLFTDIKMGEDMMVNGTPMVYINGERDNTRIKYETLGK